MIERRKLNAKARNERFLDVWSGDFHSLCVQLGILARGATSEEAAISEAFAARFILRVLRESKWLRWRFPAALSTGSRSGFAAWMHKHGARKFGLTAEAIRKIAGTFRKPPGRKVINLYANLPHLQQQFPLALLPIGQLEFLEYLVATRGVSHGLTDEEILWFLHQTAADPARSLALTYLLQPEWQREFPRALEPAGWHFFVQTVRDRYRLASARRLPLPNEFETAPADSAGVNLVSHFCYSSGIQQAALFTRLALESCGVSTSCRDVPAGVGTELPDRLPWLGLETHPVTIITVPPVPYLARCYERSGLFRRPAAYRVGYWAWELERVPDEWVQLASLVDEIWAPTNFVAEAMRARMPLPVHRMLPGVEVREVEPVPRASIGVPADDFVFFFMFDMASQMHRKNPLAVIEAFRRAFTAHQPATLVIKVSRGELLPDDRALLREAAQSYGVKLIDETLPRAASYAMLAMCDCFVSLHRAEGFGLALAEAMLLGKPAIATRYSGNVDYMHDGNSLLVDFEMTEIREDRPIYTRGNRWAEPSIDHAAALMRQVFENRAAAKELGARAQKELREKLSLRAAGARMALRLEQIARAVNSRIAS